jgi:DNA-binding beta-propeller fold protein YncE
MKKIFISRFVLLIFIIPGINLYAQTPKLNNAFYYSSGIVVDSKGNVFVTGKNNRVIKITADGKAELFAGGGRNNKDGRGKDAGFGDTRGIAIDAADNMYVADGACIRKITTEGAVSTIAGNNNFIIQDGDRSTASFRRPEFITIDNNGNIYVTDQGFDKTKQEDYNVIRKITTRGIVTTLKAAPGSADDFRSHWIRGLVCDEEGNLYVCALGFSSCIKKITPDGTITTLTGNCDAKKITAIFKEGDIRTAQIVCPTGLAINNSGELFFSDVRLHRIVKIADNKVITVAGNSKITSGNIAGGADPGYADGKARQALFYSPAGIAFDRAGNLYIVDGSSRNNSYIRKLSTDGTVSTFCKHLWNPKTQQYEEAD